MKNVGIRAVKDGLSRYIRQLKPGEAIAITDRGRVVAELRAAGTAEGASLPLTDRYRHLVNQGIIRAAPESGDPLQDWPAAKEVKLEKGTVTGLIGEDRGA